MEALRGLLRAWERGKPLKLPARQIAESEGIDLERGRERRQAHQSGRGPRRLPALAVVIVGAPRSGTSHLQHLLAYQRGFAWLGVGSCWAWPTYTLANGDAQPIADLPATIFQRDSKALRMSPSIMVPSEAEDLMARSIPCYRHLGGHHYDLRPARIDSVDLLLDAISDHLHHFETDRVVLKSPFSTFRIKELRAAFGRAAQFVHIHRNGYAAAASIAQNGFRYDHGGASASAIESWAEFTKAAVRQRDQVPMHTISFEDLKDDPAVQLEELLSWLGVDGQIRLPEGQPQPRQVDARERVPLVEEVHRLVGRTSNGMY